MSDVLIGPHDLIGVDFCRVDEFVPISFCCPLIFVLVYVMSYPVDPCFSYFHVMPIVIRKN